MTQSSTSNNSNPIPDLRIVATECLIPHEHHDQQRLTPLAKRLKADNILVNPPVVARLDEERFVVLDGANRSTAFKELGIRHCLVQVVPYQPPITELYTHHHLVMGIEATELDTRIAAIEGIKPSVTNLMEARAQLSGLLLLSYYVRRDGSITALRGSMDLQRRTELLNELVAVYLGSGRLQRVSSDDIDTLLPLYPDASAILVFSSYKPAEIIKLASSGARLPPGITRHIIHGRAIRINYSLDVLAADETIEAKQADLDQWLRNKLAKRQMRFYAESTYLFDE